MTWRDRAVCRYDPDMWFTSADRVAAVHICRHHCPVVKECHTAIVPGATTSGVMGGVAFDDDGEPMKKWGSGKAAAVCGPDCRAYRKEQ
jgi:hypothetical protein